MSIQELRRNRVLVACVPEELPSLSDLLRKEGFEPVAASDGDRALDLLLHGSAEAALLDLVLPGKSSLQALEEARQAGLDIPIILFTSFGGVKTAVEAMKRGASDYLLKPLQQREVAQAIHRGLLGRRPPPTAPRGQAPPQQSQKLEALGRLTSAVAHDLNNYLTVMLGYSRLMLETVPSADPLHDNLDEIQKAAERAATLTRQLLAFSRKQSPAPRRLDPNTLLADMDSMLRRLLGKDVVLVTSLEPNLGLVRADPGQLEQVVMNLVLNARDAMPWGGTLTLATARIAVEPAGLVASASAPPAAQIMLLVSDTGTGIAPENQAHLFEPFFTTKEKGTGLGLPIVRDIVHQAGGTIQVASVPGQGTTFMIHLPEAVENGSAPLLPPQPLGGPIVVHGSETVLIVEDNDGVRGVLREFLNKHGYAVLEAGSSGEALRLGEQFQGPIDLLVTDVVMPYMDGPELVRRLSLYRPALRVLYMSGYPAAVLSQHGLEEDGMPFLQKPFNMDALAREIRHVLDRPA